MNLVETYEILRPGIIAFASRLIKTKEGEPTPLFPEIIGTGFLVQFNHVGYLVTARHVAEELGGDPFLVDLNSKNRDGVNKIAGDEVDLGEDLVGNSHT